MSERAIWRIGCTAIVVVGALCTYVLGGGEWFFAGLVWGWLSSMWATFADPRGIYGSESPRLRPERGEG